jgi:SAM-dependent methyltransferase
VLRSAGRVLKPGGRFAYATWCGPEECVAFGMVEEAVQAHGTLDLGLPAGPDYARYADPDHARKLLAAAGFVTIESTRVPQVWRCPSPDSVFEAVSQATIVAAAVLEAQSDQARSRIKAFLRERTASFAKGDIYEVPMPALVAAGRKPG